MLVIISISLQFHHLLLLLINHGTFFLVNVFILPLSYMQVTAQVNEQVQQVRTNASVATESLTSTAGHVADSISSTATQVRESVASTTAKFSSSLNVSLKDGADSEDEFEESSGSDNPEFRGLSGLRNYVVLQEDEGVLVKLRDFYFFMMKKPLPEFALGMMAAPLALSMVFTLLYLPEFQGLAYDETARDFLNAADGTELNMSMCS